MDIFLRRIINGLSVLLLVSASLAANAQILVQDFETLNSLGSFSATSPTKGQVNALLQASPTNQSRFSLYEVPGQGQTMLRLNKGGAERVWWLRENGATVPKVLKLQFKMMVNEASSTSKVGDIGSFYIGENLLYNAFYPVKDDRFATIDVTWEGGNNFSVNNIFDTDPVSGVEDRRGTFTMAGLSTIAIFMNNSGGVYSYVSPQGLQEDIGVGKIDIWVDGAKVVDEVDARAQAPLSQVKFLSRGNNLVGEAFFDELLVEAVPAYVAPPSLDPAGGTYTVGTGGDFPSLTNPGGAFQALNNLGTITGPFTFLIISDLMGETGAVPLNQIAGASSTNTIQFRPQDANTYTIMGANDNAAGALIRLNGADWVRFDGRVLTETAEGLNVNRYLVFRNAGSAPTFHLYNDATNNIMAYNNVQGASFSVNEGVIFLGEGTAIGNDANSIRYNRIGGYGNQTPVNALASRNTTAGNLTEDILVEGNQFYGFAASASLNVGSFPCSILAGQGSSQWSVLGNHLFQEKQAAPVVSTGKFVLNGVCIAAGTDHLIQSNYIGGSAPFAQGAPLAVTTNGDPGVYPSLVPFSIETVDGVVDLIGNTTTNIDVTGDPFACEALAFGAVVTAGEANFIENIFGDPSGASSITARNNYSNPADGGSYLLAPIYYQAKGTNLSSGRVRDNFIGSVRLEGNAAGGGLTDIHFRGILNNQNATNSEISQNTITNIASDVSGGIGVSMMGIHARGRGNTAISRNVIYDFTNDSEVGSLECSSTSINDANTMGIVVDNITGEALVANNMITFEDSRPDSEAVYLGIFVPSNSPNRTNVYYNSVFITGGDNESSGSSFVFYRNGASPTVVQNNILLNTRATDNPNFVIGTTATTGWTSGYNLLYRESGSPTLDDFGLYGATLVDNCQAWITLTASEGSICANVAEDFIDPASGNLRIARRGGTASPILDAGVEVAAVETDIDFVIRVDPDIGASEGFNTWIGVIDTDWFNPGNWSAGVVPSCSGNPDLLGYNQVSIAPIGTRIYDKVVLFQPVIMKGPGPADYRNLMIQEGASVTIGESQARLRQCGGKLDPLREGITNRGTITYAAPGRISLKGFLNNEGLFVPGNGTLQLNGDEQQNISSSDELQVWRLLVEGSGNKQLLTDVVVLNTLDLVQGIVLSSDENTLIMDFGATMGEESSPDNDTYVAGPMIKRFNTTDEFVFPVGDENKLGRAALIPASIAPAVFVVEYHFDEPPFPIVNSPATAELFRDDIERVSEDEYWTILPLSGNTDMQVVLYWDQNSGVEPIVNKEEDLIVARWNTTFPAWVSEGNEGIEPAPAPALGRLFSASQVSGFGVFTFGTTDPNVPLPVELLSFTATLQKNDVKLAWETSMEKNSSHFNIQRSQDGVSFETIGKVASAGNSQQSKYYEFSDTGIAKELAGVIYYRLEQVDHDGAAEYSPLSSVKLPDETFAIRGIYPNPFRDNLVLNVKGAKEQRILLRLLDINGKQLLRQHVNVAGGENIMPVLDVQYLENGMYILEVSSSDATRQYKVVKR